MSELIVWKNQQINKMRKDIDRLFDRFCSDFGVNLMPAEFIKGISINMYQTSDTLTVEVKLPGIDPQDLDISLTSNTLTIRGKKKQEETIKDNGLDKRVERRSETFTRTITLPCRVKVEEIRATYKNETLNMVMPKWKPEEAQWIKVNFE